jgi:hypothetical protein
MAAVVAPVAGRNHIIRGSAAGARLTAAGFSGLSRPRRDAAVLQ